MPSPETPNFLKQKYWDKEVFRDQTQKAVEKKQRLEGDEFSISQKPQEQISVYLERIKNIVESKGQLFREISLYSKFIIKEENISDDYLKNILLGNFAELKGYDRDKLKDSQIKEQVLKMFEAETQSNFETYQIPQEQKDQIKEQTIEDQKASLDRWFEYLTGAQSKNYPDQFKYWAFSEMLKLGAQDRERKDFNKRTENTAAPFSELNQQALSLVLDELQRKYQNQASRISLEDKAQQQEFSQRLKNENFAKLYGWALDYVNSLKLPKERLPIIEGQWKKFAKGTDPKVLADTLQGFNTGWCIAGQGTAQSYLSHSDIWIYFSQDQDKANVIPRAAIVTDGSRVSEVRGIIQTEKEKQHLDDYIAPVVEQKLKTLPGGETWQSSMEDMKILAEIHFKHLQKQPLTKDELVFFYELDHQIQGLGYGQDPRIDQIRETRDPKKDASIIFECDSSQISNKPEDINQNTKAYIGQLEKGIFDIIQKNNIEYIYTSFPEGKIQRYNIEIGVKTKDQLIKEMKANKNIYITDYAQDMLNSPDFQISKQKETVNLVRLTVKDLGFPNGATSDQIYQKAQELGLQLCPAEVGPHLRLKEPLIKEWTLIAMKQITDRDGYPYVFSLHWLADRFDLDSHWAHPSDEWRSSNEFVFRFRKFLETK